ncbi:MAG TPA: type I phosphomannose isomerase catalytic subunit [Candidatus Angelobacter sp.]
MPHLYPLRLHPEFYERVWGARNLEPIYSREVTGEPVGEVWLTGDKCRVANGPFAGRTLDDLSRELGADFLGEAARDSRFPLLLKFLFPKEKLSVQVHPDDEAAARDGEPCGKTECWYVLHAPEGAQVGLGLKPGVGKDQVKRAIHETRMEELLNWIDLHPGDLIYVDAGTVHTIGPGAVLLEIQQNSDTTYRLYDYGRPRELHIDAGMLAIKESTHAGKVKQQNANAEDGKSQANVVTSPCFVVDKFSLSRPWEFRRPRHARRSVWCLAAIRGAGVILSDSSEPISFNCGEVVVVPAAVEKLTVKPRWDLPPELEFLCASLPVEKVGHPKTVLVENIATVAP